MHLTIPTSYRISRAGGDHYELHRANLTETEITRIGAVVLTTISQTLAASIGHTPEYLVRQAIDIAAHRGAITRSARDRLVDAGTEGASS